ncbi:MAG: MFS transporter [Roseiflexaceae bacterium]|jgi:predicted MFS family arabinose efflux permease|nr:MFS transporter [Chloroflexaceae bacterium]MCE2851505.1 MFS transporter [Chloroflexaceae bacterium]
MRFRYVFAAFAFGYMVASFLRAANAVISADLMRELSLSADQLGTMTSIYYISFSLMQLPLGAALDRYGSRTAIPLLMIPTVIGCLLFATATSFWPLALGRTLIGLGTAGGLMGAVKTFGNWVPKNQLATMTSIMVALGACGGLLSTSPMAYLADIYGWRTVFVWSAPIVACIALGIRAIGHDAPQAASVRQPGMHMMAGYKEIYTHATFIRMAPLYFSMLGSMLAVQTLWAGPFAFDVARATSSDVGLLLLVLGIGAVVGYAVSGVLSDRFGGVRVLIIAQIIMLSSLAYFVFLPIPASTTVLLYIYGSFGFGASFNVIMLPQVRTLFADAMSGRAATALNIFGFLGGWVLQWIMGQVINLNGRTANGHYLVSGYQWAFTIPFVLGCIALIVYVPLIRTLQKG